MLTRVWQEGDSWSKVAYLETFDSRNFRELLELNPSFDIRTEPSTGVPILVQAEVGIKGKGTGTLNQVDLNFDLRKTGQKTSPELDIFPWKDLSEYTKRLSEYTAAALFQVDRVNGYSMDSPQILNSSYRG